MSEPKPGMLSASEGPPPPAPREAAYGPGPAWLREGLSGGGGLKYPCIADPCGIGGDDICC